METIPIAKPLECYIKTYGLHSIFHSTKAEVVGLLKYLEKHIEYIVQHEQDCMEILVYGDNLGAITLLNNGMSKDVHMHLLIQKIYNLLKRTQKPFSFAWLRRSTPRIELADQLGRISEFSLTQITKNLITQTFNIKFFIPDIFRDISNLPIRLPSHLFNSLKVSNKIPLVLVPFPMKNGAAMKALDLIERIGIPVLFGFPKFSIRFFHRICSDKKILTLPEITPRYFKFSPKTRLPNKNFPYIFVLLN